jgi:hypothetical protein
MACSCNIAAHNNRFNKAVLQTEAEYFQNEEEVKDIIERPIWRSLYLERAALNLEKIRNTYNNEKIIDSYENLMLEACGKQEVKIKFQKQPPDEVRQKAS